MTGPILRLSGVTRRFGGLVAVDRLGFDVAPGVIHGLIGPNGAGKSTAFDLVAGTRPVSAGTIAFQGVDLTGMKLERRVRAGIARTFQTPRLWERMTALETVMTGAHTTGRIGIAGAMLRIGAKRAEEARLRSAALDLLARVGLSGDAELLASRLPYGRRRLLEIARALASRPKLLLLDEVTSGLNPVETEEVGTLIRSLRDGGLTVMIVEHDMRFVMGLCDRVSVLNLGALIAEGTPAEITGNATVVEAYLGSSTGSGPARRAERRRAERTDAGTVRA